MSEFYVGRTATVAENTRAGTPARTHASQPSFCQSAKAKAKACRPVDTLAARRAAMDVLSSRARITCSSSEVPLGRASAAGAEQGEAEAADPFLS